LLPKDRRDLRAAVREAQADTASAAKFSPELLSTNRRNVAVDSSRVERAEAIEEEVESEGSC